MSSKSKKQLKPFYSVLIIIITLFSIVICKMEIRRLGYTVWKQARLAKVAQDQKSYSRLNFAKLTRPERIESYAKNYFSLKKAKRGQIIQLSSNN